ncbi:lipopolysaccharide transport system permease protein [Algoriphagus ratkowskyi]|uniref:Transport permease protein n=1 Tax=Algoriphagus ratkowskyi TaxID=57028 RepID=A0A2W7RTB6_9BACT|nr:ABC transporter permease [Algoriphagus ratkowskyi]PZX57789.1 lipopolysaccharide transport system permease protein [Algoriphagus ratkowskyi]TXD79053.1 ABC transporter permease [Algoriphagus ratkowskyi]
MIEEKKENLDWDFRIEANNDPLNVGFSQVWKYRDLLMLFVKRDIVTVYKQTILGPLWFFIQPILTTITFMFIFGNLAGISTDGVPQILFYLSGITIWNYFNETLIQTSKTFTENAPIFGKVYFPRLVLPLSKVISNLLKFGIQFGLFVITLLVYYFLGKDVYPNIYILLTPLLLLLMGGLGLGFGLISSALTTKYRDLTFLIAFGVQLLMYATPVIYPMSSISDKYQMYIWLNPLTSIVESFKYAYLGSGVLDWFWLSYSCVFTLILLIVGAITFNRIEKSFVDTV